MTQQPLQAEIISIGDELLIGQTINTNAAWMGEQLNLYNIAVKRTTVIGDDREEIWQALDEASGRSNVVLITGGLGPTKDDVTKKTLAEYFNSEVIVHEPTLKRVTDFFAAKKVPLLEVNKQQALVPAVCEVIENTRGTAPGMWFTNDKAVFISMPGVPYEMRGMMEDVILGKLTAMSNQPAITHHTILTIGIGESMLAEKIKDWEDSLSAHHIKLAYLPSPGMVKLRLSHFGQGTAPAMQSIEQLEKELYTLIGEYIFGHNKETLEEIVGSLLIQKGLTVAVAESCTGGEIAHLLTSVPGSSRYFKGSITAYANEVKQNLLEVPAALIEQHGVVSAQVAEAMALGVKKLIGSDFALSTTGIAGPDGGSEEKPVGLVWMAVASAEGVKSWKFQFGPNRSRNIQMASHSALNQLRKEILATYPC